MSDLHFTQATLIETPQQRLTGLSWPSTFSGGWFSAFSFSGLTGDNLQHGQPQKNGAAFFTAQA
jgi:hypothetical protein